MNSRVLVTGGAGYIGSHTAVEPKFVEADCCDSEAMRRVFEGNDLDSVIYFAISRASQNRGNIYST